jgi:hypothetical protein
MRHRTITAAVVAGVDRLLDLGCAHAEIAERLGVSESLVGVIAGDRIGRQRRLPPEIVGPQPPTPQRSTDAATIRRIHRMLDVNILTQSQIAREAGVSTRTVERIAAGQRVPTSSERPYVFRDLGEQFLKRPIRCDRCGALLSIVPCRACQALCL